MKILTNDAGEKYYEAPHEPREILTIRVKSDGVVYAVRVDEEIGVFLSGEDLPSLLGLVPETIAQLRKLKVEIGERGV